MNAVEQLARVRIPWRWTHAGYVVLGIAVLVAAWVLQPGEDAFVYLPNGTRFGDTCAFITTLGVPCPQCGMTRAFVHAARGHFITAFLYNPAGLGLFFYSQLGLVLGVLRLVKDSPRYAQLPWRFAAGMAIVWCVVYVAGYALRLGGVNPL